MKNISSRDDRLLVETEKGRVCVCVCDTGGGSVGRAGSVQKGKEEGIYPRGEVFTRKGKAVFRTRVL